MASSLFKFQLFNFEVQWPLARKYCNGEIIGENVIHSIPTWMSAAAVYSLIDLLGNWHPLPSELLISSSKEKSLIPERVSLHSFQQVSGKTHFDKSFVGGPYLRWYMRAFPALKTGNSLSDTLVWGNRYTRYIRTWIPFQDTSAAAASHRP